MQAFLNDVKIKELYLERVKEHAKADEIIKGAYWKEGKGCAVGCTIHSSNHKAYETELGIPEWLAYVEDCLFEGMITIKSKEWPFRFLNSINVGSDLNKIKAPFQIMVLENVLKTLEELEFKDKNFSDVIKCVSESKSVVKDVIKLWKEYPELSDSAASAASAARAARAASAARSARDASAASSAWSAWAASSASSAWAASSASAASAAWASRDASAAEASGVSWFAWVAWAVRSARAASAACSSSKQETFEYFADELIALIEGCN